MCNDYIKQWLRHKQSVNEAMQIMCNENNSLCHRPNKHMSLRLSSSHCRQTCHAHYEGQGSKRFFFMVEAFQ